MKKLTAFNELVEEGRRLRGRWELGRNHELHYRSRGFSEEVGWRGSLVAAEPGALVAAFTERQADQNPVTRLAKLTGTWKVNARNQLVFEVEKEGGRKDVLTFRSGWKLNEKNELVYRYEQTDLKTKRKILRGLAFQGRWNFAGPNALVYLLGRDSDSGFRFRGAFQTESVLAKKGEIRYQLGAEVNGRRRIRELVFFGKWKVSRDLGLSFELTGAKDKQAFAFGGEYSLGGSKQIAVNLKTITGKPLGVELVFTKNFFGRDGQAFARLEKSLEESGAEAGMRFRF